MRHILLAVGWACVGLGVAGMFLPVMPTTVFLLIAAWAFSKCSLRFHRWLFEHPRLGRPVRDWHEHGVIPVRAKAMAVTMMTASLLCITLFVAETWVLPTILGVALGAVAAFILTRPSRVVVRPVR